MSVDIINKVNSGDIKKCIAVRELIKDIKSKLEANNEISLQEIADDFNSQNIYNSRGRPHTAALVSWGILTYLGESYRRNEKSTKKHTSSKAEIDNSSQISEGVQVKSFKANVESNRIKKQKQSLIATLSNSSTDELMQELKNRNYRVMIST